MNSQADYSAESRGVAMNLFAILGFIAILLAGLWATVQLVKQVSRFSVDFAKPTFALPWGGGEALTLNTPEELISGKEGTLSWKLKTDAEGTLAFSYACRKDFYLKMQTAPGEYRAVPCNAPYTIPATDTELTFIPVLQNGADTRLDAPFSLVFTPTTGEEITAHSAFMVKHATTLATEVTETPSVVTEPMKEGVTGERTMVAAPRTYAAAPTYYKTVEKVVPVRNSDPSGQADLSTKIVDAGLVAAGKYAVKFEIANLGTKLADNWTFTATLPTNPAYTYVSESQPALYAGERMEFVITFDRVVSGDFLLTVDAQDQIAESVETNNAVSHKIQL